MPLVKPHSESNPAKQAIVLDLGDLGKAAELLREKVKADAKALLEKANAEADGIVAQAEAKGFDQGHAKGLEQGLADGKTQGARQALEAAQANYEQLAQAWQEQMATLEQAMQAIQAEAADAVLLFALRFAHKLTKRQIACDREAVLPQLETALARVLKPVAITVLIHPEDRPLLEDAAPHLVKRFDHVQQIHLLDDDSIQRGGCLVRYGRGLIDATVDTQMDRILSLLVDDPNTLEQALGPLPGAEADNGLTTEAPSQAAAETATDTAASQESGQAANPDPAPGVHGAHEIDDTPGTPDTLDTPEPPVA